jgi:hypothetical protein
MKPTDILQRLDRDTVANVKLHYIDRTHGETEESYVVFSRLDGTVGDEDFAATALLAIAIHMGCEEADLQELEVVTWTEAQWDRAQLSTIRPGQLNCYPPIELIDFEVPNNVRPKYFIEPNFGGLEECFLCSSSAGPLLLYWHSTG